MTLHDIIICLGSFVILLSFIMAVYVSFITKKKYLFHFYFCPLLGLLISVNSIQISYLKHLNPNISFLLQNLLLSFELIFWNFFFLSMFEKKPSYFRKNFLFFLLPFVILYYKDIFSRPIFLMYSIFNLWKCFFCLIHFYSLFKRKSVIPIQNDSSFWIITGLFFYSAFTLPEYSLHDYLRNNLNSILMSNLFASTNIAILIMHILFIKAYLCQLQEKKIL